MIAKLENFLNILHYCFYIISCKLDLISNIINPLAYLHKIPFIKKRHEKLGFNLNKEVNKAFNDKNFGISIFNSGGFIIGLIFILFFDLTLISGNLLGIHLNLTYLHFSLFIITSYSICYFFIFKKDKYLVYFNKFEMWTKKEKRKFLLLSITISVGVISLFFINLIFFKPK